MALVSEAKPMELAGDPAHLSLILSVLSRVMAVNINEGQK